MICNILKMHNNDNTYNIKKIITIINVEDDELLLLFIMMMVCCC